MAKACWKVGIQISITNQADYEIASLKKCLMADFTHLLMVCDDAKKLQRLQEAGENALAEAEHPRLKWFLNDEVPGFLRELRGVAVAGSVAGRTVKVRHARADLESEAKAPTAINKAVAEPVRSEEGVCKQGIAGCNSGMLASRQVV